MARVVMDPKFLGLVEAEGLALLDDKLGPSIAADARTYAPIGYSQPATPRTPPHEAGELKASIEHHMEGPTLIVEAHAPYAAYVELGTRPHGIDAHGHPSLWNPVTDQFFGPHVNHPGQRPEPYLRPALYQQRAE